MQLETNPTKTPQQQAELATKRRQLVELDQNNSLTTQISNLEREIKELDNKPTRIKAEEALLTSKKKQLAELLNQQSSSTNNAQLKDKTALYVGVE